MRQIATRIDPAAEQALSELMAATGKTQSQVIREALVSARRAHLEDQLRAEAERCRDDPADRSNSETVLTEMRDRRAW
jgi:hypothetical protein